MSATAGAVSSRRLPLGRMFLNVPFDYLAIGGGASLLVVAGLALAGQLGSASPAGLAIPYLVLACNSAHFGASTVRLYTKPGAFRVWPFLTMGLPLATIAVVTASVFFPERIGANLQALYLTWSPFHYAAQAFGLACMYHYRSGGALETPERRLLYATCLLPFLLAFLDSTDAGLRWLVPHSFLAGHPAVEGWIAAAAGTAAVLTFVAPVALAAQLRLGGRPGLPLISWLVVFSNGIWWIVFRFYDAFVWATVFHGVQYLAIVMIFHAKDQMARPGNRRGPLAHALLFYAASLGLGYLLFYVWPFAYRFAGFGLAESILLCAAVVNVHHFVVDRYIWRLRRDPNYEVVVAR